MNDHPTSSRAPSRALFLAALVFGGALLGFGGAMVWQTTGGRGATEQVVHDYLLAHPEILPEAVDKLQSKQMLARIDPLRGTLETAYPGAVLGNPAGKVTLVNVFASWCAPCREEHPVLLALAQDKRFVMAALNYKDQPENARRFLGDLGNPFQAIGVDEAGRTAIDWGVYGVPETFVIGKDGKIAYKHVGPLTPETAQTLLLPQIDKALAAPN